MDEKKRDVGVFMGALLGLIVVLLLVIVYQHATCYSAEDVRWLIDNWLEEEAIDDAWGEPSRMSIQELPAGNLFQTIAPMYSVCYSRQIGFEEDILCCAKPLANITTSDNKELLICDRLQVVEVDDRRLIIRD